MPDFLRVEQDAGRPPLKFKTREELENFLKSELEFSHLFIGGMGQFLNSELVGAQTHLNRALHLLQNHPDTDDNLDQIDQLIAAYARIFPRQPSAERALLESLIGEPGAMRAAAYILFGNGTDARGHFTPRDWAIGGFAASALHFGVTPQAKPIARDISARQQAEHDRLMRKLTDDIEELEARFSQKLQTASAAIDRSHSYLMTRLERFRRLRRAYAKRTVNEINAVHKIYREQMLLQEPVQYWKDKEIEHNNKAGKWLIVLIFAGVSVLVLPALAGLAFLGGQSVDSGVLSYLRPASSGPTWAQLLRDAKGLALVALASGVSVWALRFASRVYLSERHLATDARERQTVVMTYIALIKEGAASESERAIVLQTLFRASGDGIVKDEGGMDPSLVGLLGKIIERR